MTNRKTITVTSDEMAFIRSTLEPINTEDEFIKHLKATYPKEVKVGYNTVNVIDFLQNINSSCLDKVSWDMGINNYEKMLWCSDAITYVDDNTFLFPARVIYWKDKVEDRLRAYKQLHKTGGTK